VCEGAEGRLENGKQPNSSLAISQINPKDLESQTKPQARAAALHEFLKNHSSEIGATLTGWLFCWRKDFKEKGFKEKP
jgi:hypothetical protein